MESDGGREAIRPATAEEAAVKRNTDCVYFLASPLTCKKGNECEYRHSEGARVNPRDCWYWLNGNCLNPKCSFRHPPLDSLFAMPMPNSGAVPPSQAAASTQNPASRAPNNNTKQNVPCYYFQWGQCLKGDWCPFMHGTQASLSSVSQQVAKASASLAEAPQISKKDSQQNSTLQQNVSELNLHKPKANLKNHIESSTAIAKLGTKADNLLNHEFSENKVLPPYSLNEEPPSLLRNITSNNSGCSQSKSWGHHVQPSDEQPENGRDTDEFVHEYSPGFDVLVEDDIKDPDYYRNEENFRRVSYHGGQNLEPEDDYDYHHSDYEHIARLERDRCNGVGNYDNYEQARGRYGWESKIADRPLDKPSLPKRRLPDRETGPNDIDGSDLRHRLKQRRGNGSKSTSNRDGRGEHSRRNEHYAEERHYSYHPRDERQFPRERSLSTRLQGRITLPGRSSTDTASNSLMEKERGWRSRGRVSPSRQMNYLARHPEGIRRQASEEFNEDGRMGRNKPTRRDGMNSLDFAGPKSLAELKGSKIDDRSNEQSIKGGGFNANLNKVKSGKVEGFQESENSPSFKGPMPLSVILKKKRESAHADRELSADPYDNNSGGESAINESVPAAVSSLQSVPLPETGKQGNDSVAGHEQEYVTLAEDGELRSNGQSPTKAGTIGTREGTDLENADEEELDNYNQRDGDFDYESGEYKADDDETTFHADEDDLEEDDDFATKVSVMLS